MRPSIIALLSLLTFAGCANDVTTTFVAPPTPDADVGVQDDAGDLPSDVGEEEPDIDAEPPPEDVVEPTPDMVETPDVVETPDAVDMPDAVEDTTPTPEPDGMGLVEADPPSPPEVDDRANLITVSVRTSTNSNAETDAPMEVCLGAGHCFNLNILDVNDRESGNTEVFHFPIDVALDEIDRVTLRTPDDDPDNDRWTPACVDVRIDGVPVYCNDDIPVHIGTGDSANEFQTWTDPAGLTEQCDSCWGGYMSHGPMLGPPGPTSVQVWVRADATRLTGLRMGTSRDLREAPMVAWAYPSAEDDFTTELTVSGLTPDTEYFYRVEIDGDTSEPTRSLRTAPAPDAHIPLRMAFGSCSRLTDQPIFTPILATRPDLFLFIGDNNYANTHHRDALRWHYRRFRGLSERGNMVANTPTMAVWDDHDFLANNSNGTCLDRDVTLSVFKEYWSNPSYGLEGNPGVYFRYRWGVVDLFMLDCRMYRPDVGDSSRRCEPDPNPPTLFHDDGPLGPTQEQWLFEGLASSDAPFKMLACGSRFNPEGSLDSWATFPEAYTRLMEVIDEEDIGGVVMLTGDIHRSAFTILPGLAYDIPEIVSSPLSYSSPSTCNPDAPGQLLCYDDTDAFITLDIDPTLADPRLTASLRNAAGQEVAEWIIHRSQLE